MSLSTIIKEIKANRPNADMDIQLGSPNTYTGRVGLKRAATEAIKRGKIEYREALLEIISKKAEGQTIEDAPAPVAAKITDLTEALRASVEEIRRRKSGGSATATAEKPEPRRRAKSA